jgi:uridine kinase
VDRSELLAHLARRIHRARRPHPLRVAIDGVDAAGKTTLADELVAPLQALGRTTIRGSIDDFHNPSEVRYRRGALSGEGYYHDSFNLERLVESLLVPFGPGGSRRYQLACFDLRRDVAVEADFSQAPEDAILLLDGVFLHRPELRGHWDLSLFVKVGFDVTIRRAERRDLALLGSLEEVRRRYAERYIPGQQLYVTECGPEARATIVVDNEVPMSPSIVRERADTV